MFGLSGSSAIAIPDDLNQHKMILTIDKLNKLEGEADSGIVKVRKFVHVGMHPRYLGGNVNIGLVHYFNSQVGHHHPGLNGILVGYGKLCLKSPSGSLINEEVFVHLDVLSDFWVFRPVVGGQLKGVVHKKSDNHVSCLVHGCFNVPCHRPQDTDEEEWCGRKVKLGQVVRFTVLRLDVSQKLPLIEGDLQADSLTPVVMSKEAGPIRVVTNEEWEEEVKNVSPVINDADSDSGIDSVGKKKKKKRKSEADHDEEEGMSKKKKRKLEEDSVTESPKKKKKKEKEKEKEKEKLVESDSSDSEDESRLVKSEAEVKEEIKVSESPKKKKKSKQNQQVEVKQELEGWDASPVKGKKKKKKDKDQDSSVMAGSTMLTSPKVEMQSPPHSLTSPQPSTSGLQKSSKKQSKKSKKDELETNRLKDQLLQSLMKTPTPSKKPSKKSKKTPKPDEAEQKSLQDSLIQNMIKTFPSSKKKK